MPVKRRRRDATTIMAFPIRGDSYTECLYPALAAEGATVLEGVFAGRWLLRHLRGVDYIHINWPSFFYAAPRRLAALRGFGIFLFLIALARLRGTRILWTVHNLYPHDRCVIAALDPLARWILVRVCMRFFVHGPSAQVEVLRKFPAMAGRTVVIDHGNWLDYYPNSIDRPTGRAKLSLATDDFVFLFVGLCKPYKNLEELLAAFAQLPEQSVLVIAGKFPDPEYRSRIFQAIEHSSVRHRIRIFSGFVPNEELQVFLGAANVVVAPYAEVLTSGTAMLALTFARPIVAPARGVLKDVITAECGVLYEPSETEGLRQAMVEVMRARFDEGRIVQIARCHDWRQSARSIVAGLAKCEGVSR